MKKKKIEINEVIESKSKNATPVDQIPWALSWLMLAIQPDRYWVFEVNTNTDIREFLKK